MKHIINSVKKILYFCFQAEAKLVLRRFRPTIIGITGSVGKTSTKEAIATLLGEHFVVWKSPKSYNSDIGIPLTILGLESAWNSPLGWIKNLLLGAWRASTRRGYPQILVLEMGVDRPGDFDRIVSWVKPDIAVVTTIGSVPVHVEFFSGPEGVAKEKSKLAHAVSKEGFVILNADDALVLDMQNNVRGSVFTYGMSENARIVGSGYKAHFRAGKPQGISFHIDYEGKSVPIKIPDVAGKQTMYALLAAAGVGIAKGLNLVEIAEGLSKYKPLAGRLHLIDGIQKSLIIDDSYNASPIAVEAALDTLAEMPADRRKIAVLGDMLELGKFTAEAHKIIGEKAASVADLVVAVGLRAKFMESSKAKEYHWFADSREAAEFLKNYVQEGDVILVKGSQGVRMERVTEALLRDPERAHELLVRQDAYWRVR